MLVLTTFSIAARCPRTGMVGVAVCTAVPAVGSLCPFAKPRVGAIATQSYANTTYGPKGLELLAKGETPEAVMTKITEEDKRAPTRQVGIVRDDRERGDHR